MRAGAFPVDVEAAAVELAAFVGDVFFRVAGGVHESGPEAGWLVGLDAFAAHRVGSSRPLDQRAMSRMTSASRRKLGPRA